MTKHIDIPGLIDVISAAAAKRTSQLLTGIHDRYVELPSSSPFQSPIEEQMFFGLVAAAHTEEHRRDVLLMMGNESPRWRMDSALRSPEFIHPTNADLEWSSLVIGQRERGEVLRIFPQVVIAAFRADFVVESFVAANEPTNSIRRVAIECDGHAFHERTKEQAMRDRSRDRAFQEMGLPVLRFTGAEIYADAVGCGAQVLKYFATVEWRAHFGEDP